jgi:hypothetical protein
MSTPKQISVSRANGAKSKGPVTDQGKLNSSRNSTRHGLLAATIVLEAEQTEPFLEMVQELYEEHRPETPTEKMLVETIASARWRQDRIWEMQKAAFDEDIASSDSPSDYDPLRAVLALRKSPDSVRSHELLLRYETALDRQISRSLLRLHQLQDRRAASAADASGQSKESSQAAQPVAPKSAPKEKSIPAKRTHQPAESKQSATAGTGLSAPSRKIHKVGSGFQPAAGISPGAR